MNFNSSRSNDKNLCSSQLNGRFEVPPGLLYVTGVSSCREKKYISYLFTTTTENQTGDE